MGAMVSKVLSVVGLGRRKKGLVFDRMPRSEDEVRRGLVTAVAGLAQVAPLDIDTAKTFAQLGFDSLQAMKFTGLLEKSLGVELEPTLLWDYPTIDSLVDFLVGKLDLGRSIA
ncbi:MAG: acyl carrier protein [bacterium]